MSESKGVWFVKVREGLYRSRDGRFEIERIWCWVAYECQGEKRTGLGATTTQRAARGLIAAHLDKRAEAK